MKLLPALLFLFLPAAVSAQYFVDDGNRYYYTIDNGTITITAGQAAGVVTIPSMEFGLPIVSIGYNAFDSTWITSLTIPNSITNIEVDAFYDCDRLTDVTIPASVINIGDDAFFFCNVLTAINVDTNNPYYSGAAGVLFDRNQTRLIRCGGGKPGSYTVPATVTNISANAFNTCTFLTNLTIGDSVISIGGGAFNGCNSLTNVTIGSGVTSIALGALDSCPSMATITVDTNNPVYSSLDGVLFDRSQTILIKVPGGKTGNYAVPNSVTNIADDAFSTCGSLTNVTIGSSVISIGDNEFKWCSGLITVTLGNNLSSIGGATFYGCSSLTGITIPSGVNRIGDWMFGYCGSLTGVTIANSVSSIGTYAFYQCPLTNITIPNGVLSIGDAAFAECDGLTSVTIPDSVTSIGQNAFSQCGNLTKVIIGNSVTNLGDYAFFSWGSPSLTAVYFRGDAPPSSVNVFFGQNNVTVYYLPGTTGWSATFDGVPTMLWNPQAQNDSSFGVQNNQFGFNIVGGTNLVIVVEASTNLANPVWTPLGTCTLTNGSSYFSDPQWTNYPSRFYRFSAP
jgi:hypothetical protein